MEDKITTKEYWESYYGKRDSHAQKKHIIGVCSEYDFFWELFLGKNPENKTLIEVGGFPGRYLAYLSNKFKAKPICLDYNSDTTQVKKSFEVMDVQSYEILQEDFTTYKTQTKYDFVLSNGFVEHFKNYDEILDLHVSYMKEGDSKLCVLIPNMRGYIRFYKYLVDYNNMKMHNLDCMYLDVFKNFAKRNNLSVKYLNYYGVFPVNVHQKLNTLQKIIYQAHRIFFKKIGNKLLRKKPSKYFSSSIIAILEKK